MIKDKNTEKAEFSNNFCVMGKHRYAEGALLDSCDYCNHAKYHKDPGDKKGRERLDVLQATLDYLILYIERHGYAPSRREIMDSCFYSSTSQVHRYLGYLAGLELIELGYGGRSRAINVVGWEWRKIVKGATAPPPATPPPAHPIKCICDDCINYWVKRANE